MLIVWNIESGRSKMSGTVLVEGRGNIDIGSCGDGCEYLMPKAASNDGKPWPDNSTVDFYHVTLNSPNSEDTDRTSERVCADRASFVTCSTGSLMGGCNVPVARDICQASCGRCK